MIQFECPVQIVLHHPAHLRFTSVGFLLWRVDRDFIYALLAILSKRSKRVDLFIPLVSCFSPDEETQSLRQFGHEP